MLVRFRICSPDYTEKTVYLERVIFIGFKLTNRILGETSPRFGFRHRKTFVGTFLENSIFIGLWPTNGISRGMEPIFQLIAPDYL